MPKTYHSAEDSLASLTLVGTELREPDMDLKSIGDGIRHCQIIPDSDSGELICPPGLDLSSGEHMRVYGELLHFSDERAHKELYLQHSKSAEKYMENDSKRGADGSHTELYKAAYHFSASALLSADHDVHHHMYVLRRLADVAEAQIDRRQFVDASMPLSFAADSIKTVNKRELDKWESVHYQQIVRRIVAIADRLKNDLRGRPELSGLASQLDEVSDQMKDLYEDA